MSQFTIGLDLAPPADFTALAVLERTARAGVPTTYMVRHLKRFPPGTPYAAIATSVGTAIADGGLAKPPVIADLTAVGVSLIPVLRPAIRPAWLVPVMLTAGQEAVEENSRWQVPKRDLVTGLQLLLQGRRLQVAPALAEAELLVRELTNYRPRVTLSTADVIDWRDRPADDLVLAVGLACWWAERNPPYVPGMYGAGRSPFLDEMFRLFPPLPESW